MADFEDNPFADPSSINPFADPSVTAVTEPTTTGEEEYNPFAEDSKPAEPEPVRLPPPPTKAEVKQQKAKEKKQTKKQKPQADRPFDPEPAIMKDIDPPPDYSPAPSTFHDPKDDELSKREAEIAEREAALSSREGNIERLGPAERPNNFPPFCTWCPKPLKPCFYINIKVEISPSEQAKMYGLLGLLLFTWLLLLLNMIVAIVGAAAAVPEVRSEYLTTMGVSILYFILFVPGSLFCWFLPAYYAYKKDSSLAFMWFFFVMLFQILSYILNAIGIPNLGACGFFNGAKFFNSNSNGRTASGAMFMILGLLWLVAVPFTVVIIILVHKYYRTSGHTMNKAMEEGVTGAASNKYVKGAVKSGVKAGVKAGTDATFN